MKLTLTLIITLGFIIGCSSRGSNVRIIEKKPPKNIQKITKHAVSQNQLPSAPKKVHKSKSVEDKNYSDKYMYPEDTSAAKKDPLMTIEFSPTPNGMRKEECLQMIGQEKFDKYSAMLGSEAASIKRCTMLKAMKK